GHPWTVRVPGDAEDVHDTTVDLDDEEYVVAPKQDTDDMEEVSRDDALGLGTKELRPGRADTPRGGWHAVTTYHARHGCLRHRDAELLQFADDAEIAPAGVLLCQAADQLYGIVGKRRATGAGVWVGPPSPDESALPVEDRPWCDQKRAP